MSCPSFFMQQALLAGRQALSGGMPNPPLGSMLAHGQQIVSQGFTQLPGGHHAQAMALLSAQAEEDLRACLLADAQ